MGPPFEIYGEWFLAHVKSTQKTHYSSPPAWPKIFMRGINFKSWEMKWCCLAWERVKGWIKACCPLWWWEISKVERWNGAVWPEGVSQTVNQSLLPPLVLERRECGPAVVAAVLVQWQGQENLNENWMEHSAAWPELVQWQGQENLNENWMEHSAAWPELVQGQARKFEWKLNGTHSAAWPEWDSKQAAAVEKIMLLQPVVVVVVGACSGCAGGRARRKFEWLERVWTQCCLAWVRQSCSSSSSRKVHAFDPFAACSGCAGARARGKFEWLERVWKQCCLAWAAVEKFMLLTLLQPVVVVVGACLQWLCWCKVKKIWMTWKMEHRQCCLAGLSETENQSPLMLLCSYAALLHCIFSLEVGGDADPIF